MITATVLQATLDEEMTEHLGHEKHQPAVAPDGNVRNGTRPRTVLTDADAAIFIDAIYVKVRDGQVGNQPFYAAIGVDLGGRREVLGLWAGKGGGESAKFWMNVLADLKNRGVPDVFFVVCDGLKGLPDAVNTVLPAAIVQACVIHLIRATLRYASRKYWDQLAR